MIILRVLFIWDWIKLNVVWKQFFPLFVKAWSLKFAVELRFKKKSRIIKIRYDDNFVLNFFYINILQPSLISVAKIALQGDFAHSSRFKSRWPTIAVSFPNSYPTLNTTASGSNKSDSANMVKVTGFVEIVEW